MKKVHFIGICGAGMSAAAKLLRAAGWQVTGTDENFYPPVSTDLEKAGIKFFKGYRKANIPGTVDMFVVGKHAGLTPEQNPEVRAAFASGRPVKSFATVLGRLTERNENIVVAGNHGKSTCAALLAWCLERAGKRPGYFIGAIPATPEQSARLAGDPGGVFVLEGDEYPSANWDERSKFLHYRPRHLLLTALAYDHLNVFPTVAAYRAPFGQLIKQVPQHGVVAACADGAGIKAVLKACGREAVFYSLSNKSDWGIIDVSYGPISRFTVTRRRHPVAQLSTGLLGRHNLENILGVTALLMTLGLVSPQQLVDGVGSFKALTRRLDRKTEQSRLPIFEGFGSSRDKAKAAIEAVKLHFPGRRLAVLFEPHTFSWRSRWALHWYDDTFAGADRVLVYQPETAAQALPDQLTLAEIVARVNKAGGKAAGFKTSDEGLKQLDRLVDDRWALLVLSSGGFAGIIQTLVAWAERKFPLKAKQ